MICLSENYRHVGAKRNVSDPFDPSVRFTLGITKWLTLISMHS